MLMKFFLNTHMSMSIDFIERGREKKETSIGCLPMYPNRDGTHHLGMYPDWELNPKHFDVCDDAITSWATWPRLNLFSWFFQVFFHALQNTSNKYFRWVYNQVHLWIQEVVIEKDRPCPWLQTNIVKPWTPAPTRLQTRWSFPLQMTQGTKR